jgi:hypothetical protein
LALNAGDSTLILKDALGVLCDHSGGCGMHIRCYKTKGSLRRYINVQSVSALLMKMSQAFEGCLVHGWDLLYTCLMSFKVHDTLQNMKNTNPEFWEELTKGQNNNQHLPTPTETLPEDVEPDIHLKDEDMDDSDLSVETLVMAMMKDHIPPIVGTQKTGTLTSLANAENNDENLPATALGIEIPEKAKELTVAPGESGRGKQTKYANKMYNARSFWCHNDKVD